ncbi:MAG: 2-dehydropantoate 2-reductase, partial [Rubricella sp.]
MTVRIGILGAGAIGCFVGAMWAAGGAQVTLVGRARIVDALNTHGLRLTGGDEIRLSPGQFTATTDPGALARCDLIVVAVKGPALAAALDDLPDAIPVLTLMNGISPPGIVAERFPGRTVLAGMVPFNVISPAPGHWHRASGGTVAVQDHPLTRNLPAVRTLGDMEPVLWGKLLLNLNNAINALSGLSLQDELSIRGYRRVLAAAQREALALLAGAGIVPARGTALPPSLVPAFLETPDWFFRPIGLRLQKIDASARSSMADDIAAGRTTEIDWLNGEVVRLAESLGRTAPINRTIADMIRQIELAPRRYSANELRLA